MVLDLRTSSDWTPKWSVLSNYVHIIIGMIGKEWAPINLIKQAVTTQPLTICETSGSHGCCVILVLVIMKGWMTIYCSGIWVCLKNRGPPIPKKYYISNVKSRDPGCNIPTHWWLFGKILKMFFFTPHAFPAKSLEKRCKNPSSPRLKQQMTSNVCPHPSLHRETPNPIGIWKGRCTFRHVTVFCWYLSPAGKARKHPKKQLEFQNSGYNPPKGGLWF